MSRHSSFTKKNTEAFKLDGSVNARDFDSVLDQFIRNTEILMRYSERKNSFYRDETSAETQEPHILGSNDSGFEFTGATFETTGTPFAEKAKKMERRLVDIFKREYSSGEELNARAYVTPANGWTETADGRLIDNGEILDGNKVREEFRLVMLGVVKDPAYVRANVTNGVIRTLETNGLVRLAYIFKNCGPKL